MDWRLGRALVVALALAGCGRSLLGDELTDDDVDFDLDEPIDRESRCPAGTPLGAAACEADFGERIETGNQADIVRALAGVWRFCSDSTADIPPGPGQDSAFNDHDGIEIEPDGTFHMLFASAAGTLERRSGLDFHGELTEPLNDKAEFITFELDSGAFREARVVASTCPPRLRLHQVASHSPEVEYAGE